MITDFSCCYSRKRILAKNENSKVFCSFNFPFLSILKNPCKISFVFAVCLSILLSGIGIAQTSYFTYQGQLKDGSSPANGSYDLRFILYDSPTGGSQVGSTWYADNHPIENGLLNTILDFGAAAFNGGERYLEIAVRAGSVDDSNHDDGTYTKLSPRQRITSSPYSILAKNVPDNSITAQKISLPLNLSGSEISDLLSVSNDWGTAISGVSSNPHDAGVMGTANYGSDAAGVVGFSSSGVGVGGSNTSSQNYGQLGTSADGVFGESVVNNGKGVHGVANGTGFSAGVFGESTTAYGVLGKSTAQGVRGEHANSGNYGWLGSPTYGAVGFTPTSNGHGVHGETSTAAGYGVYGQCNSNQNCGFLAHDTIGAYGKSSSSEGKGVYGEAPNTSNVGYGVYGTTSGPSSSFPNITSCGVKGVATATNTIGVMGITDASIGLGVAGIADNGYGIYGKSDNGTAGYFSGNVYVTGNVHVDGNMTKGGGDFKIDHPLDPENKYLHHSFVESPDMKNIYDGVIVLDEKGEGTIELPNWFEALNKDFRYQLTCIGGFSKVYISEEIKNNQFKIAGGSLGLKVSWMVTGIRKDPYAEKHRIPIEEDKPPNEKGKYIYPELYGKSKEMAVGYEMMQSAKNISGNKM